MIEALAEFHWLRPWWFLAAAPAFWLHRRMLRAHGNNPWRRWVDPGLLRALSGGDRRPASRLSAHAALAAWLLAVTSLAGPTWQRLPQPLFQQSDALVAILDLGPSMDSSDLPPSRIVRAHRKLSDLLDRRHDGATGLVVFGASAHVVVPLTDDIDTIKSLLSVLQPSLMPAPGNQALGAFELGLALMERAGVAAGERRLLLLSDGIHDGQRARIAERVNAAGATLFVIGVGTEQGGSLPLGNNRQASRSGGRSRFSKLAREQLRRLAADSGGVYMDIDLQDGDLDRIQPAGRGTAEVSQVERDFDVWREQGPWLLLALLPIVAWAFRRGVVAAWLLTPLLLAWPDISAAAEQNRWWQNRAQREALRHDDGLRMYRQGDFDAARERFEEMDRPHGHYNRGNALAKSGQLEEAIEAYDQALSGNSRMDDAVFNRALVAALLQQQQKQQQQNQGGDSNDANQGEPNDGQSEGNSPQAGRQSEDGSPTPANQESQPGQDGEAQDGDAQQQADAQRGPDGQPSPGDTESQADSGSDPSNESEGPIAERGETGENNEDGSDSGTLRSVQEMRDDERQQALMQWLRRLPDDPGALLRRKFQYQYQEQRQRR